MLPPRRGVILVVLALLSLPTEAEAQISVFLSEDSNDPGAPLELDTDSSVTLRLYVDIQGDSTTTGTVCEDGDGSELCGYDLTLETTGSLALTGFSSVADVRYSLSASRMRLNAVEAISGGSGQVYVGDLSVETHSGTRIDLTAGEVLDASLSLAPLPAKPLVLVPEPGIVVSLLFGISGLALLARRRTG